MIIEDKRGRWKRAAPRYRSVDDVANSALRKSHHQTLELARESLDQDSINTRDFTWVTFAMDKSKIKLAKTLIRKFQDDLLSLLKEDAAPDEVYRLGIQLFPITKIIGERK